MFMGKGFHSGMNIRSQGTLEAVLEAACHSLQVQIFVGFFFPFFFLLCAFGRLHGGRFTLRPWYFLVLSHSVCYRHFFPLALLFCLHPFCIFVLPLSG